MDVEEKQKTNEKVLVNETSRPKEKNKTSEAKKNENEELNATKKKLKQHYQSQDKLASLFDDTEQSIDTCYIRLKMKKMKNMIIIKKKMENGQTH
ncbi:hypothetical protein RFI_40051 [Reticulomyxa filosa]|uniref:Uncharacterized protein n=1 Tax=Reticulomyxa filosa TaxID=46433 RepID=X6L7X5_RETFI|nr:hypothetical protein RFI_40051 [Reticulomyxa filosa]|eukprot:ETN97478.1 hypothetical protein RFI_40051 [Reticulomyxa filosa]